MTTAKNPIGQIKTSKTVYCEVCGCSHKRNVKAFVYENTTESINKAKVELTSKINKEYTCRICKSITRELNQ